MKKLNLSILQALKLSQRLLGDSYPNVATLLNNLAELYYSQGRYESAETLYLQGLQLRQRLLGENHPDVASSLNNLVASYKSQGRYEEAEPLLIQALDISIILLKGSNIKWDSMGCILKPKESPYD